MIINALNSGASMFMADLEDSNSPTWDNIVGGQINLRDAVRGDISFSSPEGKSYKLVRNRPCCWCVRAAGISSSGTSGGWRTGLRLAVRFRAVSSSTTRSPDGEGLRSLFLSAQAAEPSRSAPVERCVSCSARIRSVFRGDDPRHGADRNHPRAFEMDEILYELKEHSAGLNCGRWDYIFSFIKVFRNHPS
jgi:malate synthase